MNAFFEPGQLPVQANEVNDNAGEDGECNGHYHIDLSFTAHFVCHGYFFFLCEEQGAEEHEEGGEGNSFDHGGVNVFSFKIFMRTLMLTIQTPSRVQPITAG